MRKIIFVLPLLLVAAFGASRVSARSLSEVQALVESRSPGALAAAEALVKETSSDANAWVVLARARLQAKQAEKAVDAAEKATRLAPKNAQTFYWLGNAYGNRIGEVGMLSKMTMAPKLRDAFEQAVKLDPALVDARYSLIEFYLQAPGAMGGGVEKAKAQVAAIGKYDRAKGLMAQARVSIHEKKPAEAIKAYEAAYALKPDDAQVRISLILAYQEVKRWKDAYTVAKQWAAEEPRKARPWYQLGRIAAESGQYLVDGEAGLRTYLKLVREPNDPEPKHAHYRLGQVLAKAGRKDEAKAELQAALKIDPKFKEAKAALSAI